MITETGRQVAHPALPEAETGGVVPGGGEQGHEGPDRPEEGGNAAEPWQRVPPLPHSPQQQHQVCI